ncbi:hypothetical protein TNCV_1075421 [Trichonephila clavipes]|uniref:Secreted protein n=1 Tax=Trichonephila clavipes TaxID=2585209 RepID=A0A8X6SPY9_TRICX|nr:hypothetical protein TNCV_1075421 [Trichonephila clavipes]
MIKITAFCDVWMMAKLIVSVAAIVGYSHCHCHIPWHRTKEALDAYLEYSSPRGFHIIPKLIWCSRGWCIPDQSLCKHGSHVFEWRYIGRTSRPRKQFNTMAKEELNIVCHV